MKYVTLEELERRIERRKAELGFTGDDYVRPNSGERRSPEKRALLLAIQKTAERHPFQANI